MISDKRQWWWLMSVQGVQILYRYATNLPNDTFAMSGDALTRSSK